MIGFALKTLTLGVLGAALAWGADLALGPPPDPLNPLHREEAALRSAFRNPSTLTELHARAIKGASLLPPTLPLHPLPGGKGDLAPRLRRGLATTALRSRITLGILPVALPLALSGIALGLSRRELTREGLRFASPTRAYLGKHLAAAALLALGLFAVTPLPLPYLLPWIATLTLALGGSLYAANLPIKL